MAQKDYYLIYELYEGDPIDIHSSIGPAPLLLDNIISKIDNVKDIQLMDNDTKKIIAQTRGDAIIIKDTVPASFNAFIKQWFKKEANMAVRSKKTEKPAEQAQAQAQALEIEVLRAKDFTKDDAKENECSIVFDMKVNGVTIYGCWYRTGSDKKGEDYEMVSFPSQKGKDGKYYNHAYVQLQQSDIDFISSEIEKML
jgi:hypothetical protein